MEDPLWPRAAALLQPPTVSAPVVAAVIGVPLSVTSISPSSAHLTPAALRRALAGFADFGAGLGVAGTVAVDLSALRVADLGDLDLGGVDKDGAAAAIAAQVTGRLATLSRRPALTVLIGGDNALTRPGMAAAAGPLADAGLLMLDAHHDLRGDHDGPTNGTPVRGLLADGVRGPNVVQIGLGSFGNSRAYRDLAEAAGIRLYDMAAVRARGIAAVMAEALEYLSARVSRIYVDLDIDVLDRAFVPGCPGARPGGMMPADLHLAAYLAGRCPQVVAMDLTEVDAGADPSGLTVQNMALALLHGLAGLAVRVGAEGAIREPK